MVFAWIFGCAFTTGTVFLFKLGALDKGVGTALEGYHHDYADIQEIIKLYWFCLIPFYLTMYTCKAALLSMYLDIFPVFMRKRRIILWTTIVYTLLALITTLVVALCLCYPIHRLWDLHEANACNGDQGKTIFIINWSLNFAGDILVFLLPWLIIPGLNVPKLLKIGLYATFLLGLITICFTILRYVYTTGAQVGNSVPLSTVVLWSIIEMNLGLVISCLPSLRPYFSANEEKPKRYQQPSASSSSSRPLGREKKPRGMRTLSTDDDLWDNRQSNRSESEIMETNAEVEECSLTMATV